MSFRVQALACMLPKSNLKVGLELLDFTYAGVDRD